MMAPPDALHSHSGGVHTHPDGLGARERRARRGALKRRKAEEEEEEEEGCGDGGAGEKIEQSHTLRIEWKWEK